MKKTGLSFQRCIQNFVILAWLAGNGSQAFAQRGVIVIQGEITAPTCVVDNVNTQSVRQVYTFDKRACAGYIEPLSATAITTSPRVKDHTLVDQANDERIRTITYR